MTAVPTLTGRPRRDEDQSGADGRIRFYLRKSFAGRFAPPDATRSRLYLGNDFPASSRENPIPLKRGECNGPLATVAARIGTSPDRSVSLPQGVAREK